MSQLLFLLQCWRNYRYALSKHKQKKQWRRGQVVLIVPCKGLDDNFDANISSFYRQDYPSYRLWFVVEAESDPAYKRLCELRGELEGQSKATEVRLMVAGRRRGCSQKVHNLLYCCRRIPPDAEILAFADSDICVRSDWLGQLIRPLHRPKHGAASGYRWFVPKRNNVATLALSSVNASVAQHLGNTLFNQVWGGSMAVRVETFRQLGIEQLWPRVVSDDLSLSRAVKKAGKKVAFVPGCLVASHQSANWRELLEFGRRQFLITRVYAPATWWVGLLSSLYSVAGLYGGAAAAWWAASKAVAGWKLVAAVPVVFLVGQLIRAGWRQRMAWVLLSEYRRQLRWSIVFDVLAGWLCSVLLLVIIVCSGFGRRITWRGIGYKLVGPDETVVLDEQG